MDINMRATGNTGQRQFPARDGRPARTVRWQEALFQQGPETRLVRVELSETQPYFQEGDAFVYRVALGVNQYGDLELTRKRECIALPKQPSKAAA